MRTTSQNCLHACRVFVFILLLLQLSPFFVLHIICIIFFLKSLFFFYQLLNVWLQAYCSILYLKPRMQVIIRSQKVKSELIAKSLAEIKKDHYKPTFLVSFHQRLSGPESFVLSCFHKIVWSVECVKFETRWICTCLYFHCWISLHFYFRPDELVLLLDTTPKVKTIMVLWCITRIV